MKIVNLTYCEEITEAHNLLLGGRGRWGARSLFSQSNTAIVYQKARSNAKAFAYYGDAIAVSSATNDSIILQGNA